MIVFNILIGIGVAVFVGEVIVQKLPKDNSFVKWWRKNVIMILPDDDPNF
jgi:hypothetical protein